VVERTGVAHESFGFGTAPTKFLQVPIFLQDLPHISVLPGVQLGAPLLLWGVGHGAIVAPEPVSGGTPFLQTVSCPFCLNLRIHDFPQGLLVSLQFHAISFFFMSDSWNTHHLQVEKVQKSKGLFPMDNTHIHDIEIDWLIRRTKE